MARMKLLLFAGIELLSLMNYRDVPFFGARFEEDTLEHSENVQEQLRRERGSLWSRMCIRYLLIKLSSV